MPRRRAVSFSGFFSKLFPSHRPEKGSTLQDGNHSGDSAYYDLNINPEELTEWNLAEDVSARRRAEIQMQADRRVARLGAERTVLNGATTISGQRASTSLHARPLNPTASHRPNEPVRLLASQTQALLESKELTRQRRRELKASGDFLPVTGYNPQTGEWDILTPTDTLSSDMTTPSMEERLTNLGQQARDAKQAYEQAKSAEESERERHKLEKAQAKLSKIEKKKHKLKHQGGTIKWNRLGRIWSSAAEPNLSPIAQSLNSDHDVTRKTPTTWKEPSEQENHNLSTHKRHVDISDGTTVHTPARRNSNEVPFSSQVTAPLRGAITSRPQHHEDNAAFLWGRRRQPKEPGGTVDEQVAVTLMPMTERKMRSRSPNDFNNQNHSIDLRIPDCHLGIFTQETDPLSLDSLEAPPLRPSRMQENHNLLKEDSAALNPPKDLDNKQTGYNRSRSAATVISYQSKSKELMRRRPSSPRGPTLSPTLRRSLSTLKVHQPAQENDKEMRGVLLTPQVVQVLQKDKSRQIPGSAESLLEDASTWTEMIPQNSAFTHITTITGYDQGLSSQGKEMNGPRQTDGHMVKQNITQKVPTSQHTHDRSHTPTIAKEEVNTTSFHCSTMWKGLQNFEHLPTTPETDTMSTPNTTARKSYLRDCSPKMSRACHSPEFEENKWRAGKKTQDLAAAVDQMAGLHPLSGRSIREAAVQAAARKAMLQSGGMAAESPSVPSPTRSQDPSPLGPSYQSLWRDMKEQTEMKRQERLPTAASAGTGDPSKSSEPGQKTKADAVNTSYIMCLFAINTMTDMGCTWWNMVRPAFDKQSGLWKRREKEMSTVADFGLVLFEIGQTANVLIRCLERLLSRVSGNGAFGFRGEGNGEPALTEWIPSAGPEPHNDRSEVNRQDICAGLSVQPGFYWSLWTVLDIL
ncbi:hypothetical protein SCAR479_08588 [Seiridium cardinale]|uniref:Uncharacterized protein n=1 Tax=Seiridium cardinale TaxID=138064 RepID=A0ABR2XLT5_9PEZI